MKPVTIAVCGGIGSGKSVVSGMVAAMGFPVYDTDSRARILMDGSDTIKSRIASEISPSAVIDGMIDRKLLSKIVFNDSQALSRLNDIVHSAVRADFVRWRDAINGPIVFLESAILFESGFDSLADVVWEVTAPRELRAVRIMKRSNLTADEAEARITAQETAGCPHIHKAISLIVNDDVEPLLPQVTILLQNFKKH